MPIGHKIDDQYSTYFLTFTVVNWIDIFTRQVYRDQFLDSLRFCQQNKGLVVHAWVIMSNHAHLVLSSEDGNLSGIVRDLKTFTSKSIIATAKSAEESRSVWMLKLFAEEAKKHKRNKNYQVWVHDNHPVELYSNKFIDQKINYIHENPVAAGIVDKAEDYLYSSARDYVGSKGLLSVIIL